MTRIPDLSLATGDYYNYDLYNYYWMLGRESPFDQHCNTAFDDHKSGIFTNEFRSLSNNHHNKWDYVQNDVHVQSQVDREGFHSFST